MDRGKLTSRFLWLWVGVVTLAYGYQFRDFARPILALLGLN